MDHQDSEKPKPDATSAPGKGDIESQDIESKDLINASGHETRAWAELLTRQHLRR
jgi:hypothetical protein